MAKQHGIAYNSNMECTFIIYISDKKVKFKITDQKLYIYKPTIKKFQSFKAQFLNTVEENKTLFTHPQIKKEKQARKLYHVLGMLSPANFKEFSA
jgi:hypothetical protein